jgi:hypothetical protein
MKTTFRKKVAFIGALMLGGLGVFQASVGVAAPRHDQNGVFPGDANRSTQATDKASRTSDADIARGSMSHGKQHGNREQGPSGRETTDQDHSQHVKGAGSSHDH